MDAKNVMGDYGLYDRDITIIKKIGDTIKVANLNAVRKTGLEVDNTKKMEIGTEKLESTLVRARTRLKEYALCNDFTYFVTLTLDKSKYDRYSLGLFQKDLSKFINNYNRYCTDEEKIQYLLVPERHEDGAWHMHGLLKGIRAKDLYINQYSYLGWCSYEDKFGFISFGKIRDKQKTASYCSKYITKNTQNNVTELGSQLYYASKGLKKPETIFKGKARLVNSAQWDYESPDGYCRLKYYDINDEIGKTLEIQ